MSELMQVVPRPVPLEAFRWDGSEACAQAIALWLVERDGRDAWGSVNYRREAHREATLLLREAEALWGDEMEVRSGEWIVRAYGRTMVCDQKTFDYYFTVAPTLQILES